MNDPVSQPKRGFWLTPFSPESAGGEERATFEAVQAAIGNAAKSAGVELQRADDIFAAGVVIDQVVERIRKADVVIATCTGRNANVFYELGVADNVGHKVVLVAARADDLPFDIHHYRAHLYETAVELATLESRVRKAIEETIETGPPAPPLGAPVDQGAPSFDRAVTLLEERRVVLEGLIPEPWSADAEAWLTRTKAMLSQLFGSDHPLMRQADAIDFSPYIRPVGTQFAPSGWPDIFKAAHREAELLIESAEYQLGLDRGDTDD